MYTKILSDEKGKEERPLWREIRWWKDDMKMNLREIG
jgi:hypothetical protein